MLQKLFQFCQKMNCNFVDDAINSSNLYERFCEQLSIEEPTRQESFLKSYNDKILRLSQEPFNSDRFTDYQAGIASEFCHSETTFYLFINNLGQLKSRNDDVEINKGKAAVLKVSDKLKKENQSKNTLITISNFCKENMYICILYKYTKSTPFKGKRLEKIYHLNCTTKLLFWCNTCDKCFNSFALLTLHFEEDDCERQNILYRCGTKQCTFESTVCQQFVHHLCKIHNDRTSLLFCAKCKIRFLLPHDLVLHIQEACPDKKKFKINESYQATNCKKDLESIFNEKTDKKLYLPNVEDFKLISALDVNESVICPPSEITKIPREFEELYENGSEVYNLLSELSSFVNDNHVLDPMIMNLCQRLKTLYEENLEIKEKMVNRYNVLRYYTDLQLSIVLKTVEKLQSKNENTQAIECARDYSDLIPREPITTDLVQARIKLNNQHNQIKQLEKQVQDLKHQVDHEQTRTEAALQELAEEKAQRFYFEFQNTDLRNELKNKDSYICKINQNLKQSQLRIDELNLELIKKGDKELSLETEQMTSEIEWLSSEAEQFITDAEKVSNEAEKLINEAELFSNKTEQLSFKVAQMLNEAEKLSSEIA